MIEGFDSNIKNYKFMALIISVCCIYGFLDSNNRKAVTTFFAEGGAAQAAHASTQLQLTSHYSPAPLASLHA